MAGTSGSAVAVFVVFCLAVLGGCGTLVSYFTSRPATTTVSPTRLTAAPTPAPTPVPTTPAPTTAAPTPAGTTPAPTPAGGCCYDCHIDYYNNAPVLAGSGLTANFLSVPLYGTYALHTNSSSYNVYTVAPCTEPINCSDYFVPPGNNPYWERLAAGTTDGRAEMNSTQYAIESCSCTQYLSNTSVADFTFNRSIYCFSEPVTFSGVVDVDTASGDWNSAVILAPGITIASGADIGHATATSRFVFYSFDSITVNWTEGHLVQAFFFAQDNLVLNYNAGFAFQSYFSIFWALGNVTVNLGSDWGLPDAGPSVLRQLRLLPDLALKLKITNNFQAVRFLKKKVRPSV
jgi:hypothetical protein